MYNKEAQKRYYQRNREKVKARVAEYRRKNKEKISQYQKEWYQRKKKEKDYTVRLEKKVDAIIKISHSCDSMAHKMEDELHMEVIRKFCPRPIVKEIDRLYRAKFNRWYS